MGGGVTLLIIIIYLVRISQWVLMHASLCVGITTVGHDLRELEPFVTHFDTPWLFPDWGVIFWKELHEGTIKATGIYSHNYNSHRTSVDLRMLLNLLCVNYCRELTFHLFVCLSVHVAPTAWASLVPGGVVKEAEGPKREPGVYCMHVHMVRIRIP